MTKKFILLATILLTGILMAMPCYCQEQYTDQDLRVFEGKVAGVDVNNSVLTVKGSFQIDFQISSDTPLKKDDNDIKLSDIGIGDYVTVEYYRSDQDSRTPSKVIKVTLEYQKDNIEGSW